MQRLLLTLLFVMTATYIGISDWIPRSFSSTLLFCSSVRDVKRGSMYGGLAPPCLGLLAEGTYPAEKQNHKHAWSSESEHALYIYIYRTKSSSFLRNRTKSLGHTKCNTYIVIYNLVAAGGSFVQVDEISVSLPSCSLMVGKCRYHLLATYCGE